MSNIKIAFLTANDATNRRSYSSTHYYMGQALLRNGFNVTFIGPLKPWEEFIGRVITKLTETIFKKKIRFLHTPYLAKRYARMAEKKMQGKEYDFIFAPAASKEIAWLKTNVPIVYTSDTTWNLLNNYYSKFSNILGISIKQGHEIEKRAIKNASLLPFPTKWVADSAIKDYDANISKIDTILWGANMDVIPKRETALARQRSAECRLLFVGVHWQRKGGAVAFETLLELERLGIKARLIICGCVPPPKFNHPRMEVIPYLNKQDETQRRQLEQLYLISDFLFLPCRAECYGIVFCEAASYGLPVIATTTGGIPEIVKNGITGQLLSLEAQGAQFAELIKNLYADEPHYMAMVKAARNRFEEVLNWDTWANMLKEQLKTYSATKK